MASPGSAASPLDYTSFRRLTFYSVLAGLCPLIPVPFLDDWVLGRIRRWMVKDLAGREGLSPGSREVEILAGGSDPSSWGCVGFLVWLVTKVVVKLITKLTRKVLIFLAIKDGVEQGVEVFHEGYLIAFAASGPRAHWVEDSGGAEALRTATRETLKGWDLSPVRQVMNATFSGSLAVLREGAALLRRGFRRRPKGQDAETSRNRESEVLEEESQLLGAVVDRLAEALWGDRDYFQRLEGRFQETLDDLG
jgi:hypothetical protein